MRVLWTPFLDAVFISGLGHLTKRTRNDIEGNLGKIIDVDIGNSLTGLRHRGKLPTHIVLDYTDIAELLIKLKDGPPDAVIKYLVHLSSRLDSSNHATS